MGWASYPYRVATTDYLCYVPVLEDSSGADRTGLARIFLSKTFALLKADAKIQKTLTIIHRTPNIFLFLTKFYDFSTLMYEKLRIFATHYAFRQ